MQNRELSVKASIEKHERELEESCKRTKDAADQILQVSSQLHLTWNEFEQAVQLVKALAHIA